MPYYADSAVSPSGATMDYSPNAGDFKAAADNLMPIDSGSPIGNALGMAAMAPMDLVDTVASNKLASWATGVQRGDLNRAVLSTTSALGMPGMANFYDQHKDGIETMSGIGGLVAADFLSKKITAPASAFMAGMRAVPFVRRIATLDQEYQNALGVVKAADTSLAARGATGIEQYIGKVSVDGMKFDAGLGEFVGTTIDTKRSTAVFKAKSLAAGVGARNSLVTEGVAYAALNQNDFLYSDDAGQNIFWQALGVAGGAGMEWLHAGYAIRKNVNSDEMRRAWASALDPQKAEESRLLWHGKKVKPDDEFQTFLGGSYTDRVTSLMNQAASLRETPVLNSTDGRSLLSSRQALATQAEKDAVETAQKLTTKGIESNGHTRFSMDSEGFGNHIAMALHRDAPALYGVEMAGGITPDMGGAQVVHEQHMSRVQERVNQVEEMLAGNVDEPISDAQQAQLQVTRKRLNYLQSLTPQVLIDGERMPISEAAAIQDFIEPVVNFNQAESDSIFKTRGQSQKPGLYEARSARDSAPVTIDTDMTIHIPGNKSIDDADHFDILRLYRASQKAVDNMASWTAPIQLPAKPNWFQLDMAQEIMERSEGRANILWPEGMTQDSAQVESFAQKAEALRKWQLKTAAGNLKTKAAGEDPESILSKLRVRYNLPRLTAYERGLTGEAMHPVESLLRGANAFGTDNLRKMPLQDIKQAVAERKRIGDMSPVTAKDVESLKGNSFSYMLDESGKPVKPILMYTRPFNKVEWSQDSVADRLAARKMQAVATMTAPEAGEFTQLVANSVMQNPDTRLAMSTHELADVQIQGSTIGNAPQTFMGSVANAVATSDHIARDNPTLLGASRVRDSVERISRDAMRQVVQGAFGDNLNLLKNPRNASSKLLLDQFHSFRGGWDLNARPTPTGDGFFGFTLADTQKNQTRWAEQFGGDMPKGQTLISPDKKPVVLDSLGLDLQNRYNQVTDQLIKEKNTILRANGMSEIERQEWYTPPPNTNGKYIGFVFGPDGKIVPGKSVVASTPKEFETLKQNLMPWLNEKGLGYTFHTQNEIKDFASIWDRAQADMINPGTTAIQPNKSGRGLITGSDVNTSAFEDSMTHLREGYLNHANDVMETIFKEQINSAKARAQMSRPISENRAKPFRDIQYRGVHDIYLENLMGRSKLAADASPVAKIWNGVEGSIDKFLEQATPAASGLWQATNGWINRAKLWDSSASSKRDFDTLTEKLGQYMPFDSAAKMIEANGLGARPWTAAGFGRGLNSFAAATLLRMMEVAHPIMNMAGVVNAMPAVVRQYTKQAGESVEDYAARVGHSASIFHLPDGTSVGVPDMAKMGALGFKRAWQETSHADYDFMVRRGYLSQEVAEFHKQFGAIESQGSWSRFFNGDGAISNPKSVGERLRSKGLVGWMSVLSDKSEDFSRSWSHMIGLELAEKLGVDNLESKHAFAHDLANKMIANYSPHNRPEIFQGAVGANIGLFQSFIQEYYQRMFRYVETKDMKSLVTQYAMQGSLFGVNSVPGWAEYNKAAGFLDKNHQDPQSTERHRFGQMAGDVIGNGVLSNIPTLFGQTGVDLYSRGDTSVRLPGFNMPPAWSIAGKVGQAMGEAIQGFRDAYDGIMTPARLTEIVANAMPNRPMAGFIQMFDHGNQVDKYGQVVSETRNALEAAYRVMGLRSQRQSDEISAFYANKTAMAQKAGADDVLRLATRAALRSGRSDALPAIYQKYLDNGGDTRHFKKWLQGNYAAATSTRGEQQLTHALKSGKYDQVARLLDAGVSLNSDEATPDTSEMYGGRQPGDELNQSTGSLGQYDGQTTIE